MGFDFNWEIFYVSSAFLTFENNAAILHIFICSRTENIFYVQKCKFLNDWEDSCAFAGFGSMSRDRRCLCAENMFPISIHSVWPDMELNFFPWQMNEARPIFSLHLRDELSCHSEDSWSIGAVSTFLELLSRFVICWARRIARICHERHRRELILMRNCERYILVFFAQR